MSLFQSFICVPWGEKWGEIRCVTSPPGFGSGTGNLQSLGTILTSIMDYVFATAGLFLLFMIVSSGYTMLTSAGNPEGIEKAKGRFTAGVVGFVIIFAAFWVLQIVEVLLGIQGTPFGFT